MTAKSAKVVPSHSLILIEDSSGGAAPTSMSGRLIASTDSCVAVGCRSDVDGDTEFTLGETGDVDPGSQPSFYGKLKTPSFIVTLRTVTGQTILEVPVTQHETTVRVWVNDPSEPDQVIVGIG